MYLRLSICVSLVIYQVASAVPLSEAGDRTDVELLQENLVTTEWTDMIYNGNVEHYPEYVEYEYEGPVEEEKIIDNVKIPFGSQYSLYYENKQGGTDVEGKLQSLSTGSITKENDGILFNEADIRDQQATGQQQQEEEYSAAEENNTIGSSLVISTLDKGAIEQTKVDSSQVAQIQADLSVEQNIADISQVAHSQDDTHRESSEMELSQVSHNQNDTNIENNDIESSQIARIEQDHYNVENSEIDLIAQQLDPNLRVIDFTLVEPKNSMHTNSRPTEPDSSNYSKPEHLINAQPYTSEIRENHPFTEPVVSLKNKKILTTTRKDNNNAASNLELYESLIQEQIERTESLLRKFEAAHVSGSKADNTLNGNKESDDNSKGDAKDFIYRESSTEPTPRSYHNMNKDPALDDTIQPSPSKETIVTVESNLINEDWKQQTNSSNKESIVENIASEKKKMFKLLQVNDNMASSLPIPRSSTATQTAITKSGVLSTSVPVVQQLSNEDDGTILFNPSNKIKLPNGAWTPSCKNVSKGMYCLRPDGEDPTMIECTGENVGFQFSCGGKMMCYSIGPYDVDCQNKQ